MISLTPNLPNGFSQTPASVSQSLLPGTSVSGALTLTTPSGIFATTSYTMTEKVNNTSSGNTSTATLGLTVIPPACTKRAPLVAISPSSATAYRDTKITYDFIVTNTDDASCPSTSFALATALPANFSRTLSNSSVIILPGVSRALTVNITSPTTAVDGNYQFTITATDRNNSTHLGSASATYIVKNDLVYPTVTIDTPLDGSTLAGTTATISASASDDIGVSRVDILINGSTKVRLTKPPYQYVWNISNLSTTTKYILNAKAFDIFGNMTTATATVMKQ